LFTNTGEKSLSKSRRVFSDEQKFAIVLEAIKGQRQITEIAAEFGVHPNQITNWKAHFLKHGASVFSKKADPELEQLEESQEGLFKKIGQQQIEIDFLKKSLQKWDVMRGGK
jgi:transposase-like protein